MAAYISVVFYVTMVLAGLIMDLALTAVGLVPEPDPNIRAELTRFSFNYTFWLNVIFGALAAYLFWLNWRHPMEHGGGARHHHHALTGSKAPSKGEPHVCSNPFGRAHVDAGGGFGKRSHTGQSLCGSANSLHKGALARRYRRVA
jgi:hypothetical protein